MNGPSASGYNGQVTFEGDFVVISRKGLMAKMYQGVKGDKRIPISSITSVQMREPKFGTDGFIQFSEVLTAAEVLWLLEEMRIQYPFTKRT